jgi:hypothetical protein
MSPDPVDEVVDYLTDGVAAACPAGPGQWCLETPPAVSPPPLLHSVFAIAADNVFAVGASGTIFHRNSTTWSVQPSGTGLNLLSVWASSASDVWVGAEAPEAGTLPPQTLLHFDGTAWSLVTAPGTPVTDINAVWGSSSTDVWFVGSTVATHWDGAAFKQFNLTGTLLAVSGTGPNDVWLAGENFQLRHFDGSALSTFLPSPGAASQALFTVLPLGATDVWVTDGTLGKETMHFGANKTWTAFGTLATLNGKLTSTTFNGLAPRSSTDIWGAGQSRVGHWDGKAWAITQPFGANVSLQSISIAAGNGWIVGENALIGHQTF